MHRFARGHSRFMNEALEQARAALNEGEVPVGAIIVRHHRVIANARNMCESLQDPTAHAEILAIQRAARSLKTWRLRGCTLYVTLEPCAMCAGAIVAARIDTVVFGAYDSRAGAAGSVLDVIGMRAPKALNHRPEVIGGVRESESADLLKEFFTNKRGV